MAGRGWTAARAAVWRAATPPEFDPPRWSLGGGVILAVTLASWSGFWAWVPCGEPGSECGPSPALALIAPLVLVCLLALWTVPWMAAVLSAVGGVVGMAQWSEVAPGFALWPFYSLALGLWLWHLRARRRRQHRIAAAVLEPLPAPALSAVRQSTSRPEWELVDVLAATVAVLGLVLGAMGYAVYARSLEEDRVSLARSVVVDGVVTSTRALDEDSDDFVAIQVRLSQVPAGVAESLEFEPWDDYVEGDEVQVRIDPRRPEWAHLVREPPDRTLPFGLANGAVLLALLSVAFVGGRRHRARSPGLAQTGGRVHVDRSAHTLYLRPLDSAWAFASLTPQPGDPILASVSRRPSDEAFVVGLEGDGAVRVVLPTGPASDAYAAEGAGRGWSERAKAAVGAHYDVLPAPVPATVPYPVDWRPSRSRRWTARLIGLGSLVLPFAAAAASGNDWVRVAVAALAVALMAVAVRLDAPRVHVDDRRIAIRHPLHQVRIPMWAVARVRMQYDQRVILIDNQGGRVDLDLGDEGAVLAGVITGYASNSTPPGPDVPGSGFEECMTVWWRETPLYLLAPLAAAGIAWLMMA